MILIALVLGGMAAIPSVSAAQSFAPLTGSAGCVIGEGAVTDSSLADCAQAKALGAVSEIAISPDDRHVYAATTTSIVLFTRAPGTGALTWAGCVSDSGGDGRPGTDGACVDGDALNGVTDVAVTPDGKFVYATAQWSSSLVWFARNPETGALTPAGCLKVAPRGDRCMGALGLMSASGLAISADGKSVYVLSGFDASIAAFARDPETGALSGAGCVSDTGSDGRCANGNALAEVGEIALGPDDGSAFAIAPYALSAYARDAATGELTPRSCALSGKLAGSSCVAAPPLSGISDIVVAPNGQVIVAASQDSAIAVLNGGDLSPVACYVHQEPTAEDTEVDESEEEELDDEEEEEDAGDEEQEEEEEEEPANPNVAKCTPTKAIGSVASLALSSDGRTLFSSGSYGYVTAFNRDPATGALTEFGCLETYGYYKSCGASRSLNGDLATTSDGRSLYASISGGLAVMSSAVAVTSRTARLSRSGRIALRLACPAQRTRPCRGSVGGSRYRVARGAAATVRVRLPGKVRRSIRRHHRLAVTVNARDADRVVRASKRKVLVSAR
jgi:6-phosphogluconolactonase (cycloisomerase 2 family)